VKVGIAEGKNRFAALVRIAERGGVITILRHGQAVAELRPLDPRPDQHEVDPFADLFKDLELKL